MRIHPPLEKATLLKRYKRFLADVELQSGAIITIHCPNTGSMRNCIVEGSDCWISKSDNPKRKYAYTWELATTPWRGRAGINTHRANALVKEAIEGNVIKELSGYDEILSEVKYGQERSRIDFLLRQNLDQENTASNKKNHQQKEKMHDCYVEVKSVTLCEDEQNGYFPDAVSERASKHLRELMHIVQEGYRAVLVFCVQHNKITSVKPADHIDPVYGETLRAARKAGVEIFAYKAKLTVREFRLTEAIPVEFSEY